MGTDVLIIVYSSVFVKNMKLKNLDKKTNSTTPIDGLPISIDNNINRLLFENHNYWFY